MQCANEEYQPVEQHLWTEPEELVTFQIAMIGRDGLVIGSDRRAVNQKSGEPLVLIQSLKQRKCSVSDSGFLICFASGGSMSWTAAQQIALHCDPSGRSASELSWQDSVRRVAASIPLPYQPGDEILVARKDISNAVWVVSRRFTNQGTVVSLMKVTDYFCVGAGCVAQFLPRHLWRPDRTIAELKTLALLTLSYAAEENPTYVGAPFDVMTLDSTGHDEWSVDEPTHEGFQKGLEYLFNREMVPHITAKE